MADKGSHYVRVTGGESGEVILRNHMKEFRHFWFTLQLYFTDDVLRPPKIRFTFCVLLRISYKETFLKLDQKFDIRL